MIYVNFDEWFEKVAFLGIIYLWQEQYLNEISNNLIINKLNIQFSHMKLTTLAMSALYA